MLLMPERQVAVKPITQKSIPTSSRFINYAARYSGESKPSLTKLNFEIEDGSLLGVIGKNLNSVNMHGPCSIATTVAYSLLYHTFCKFMRASGF